MMTARTPKVETPLPVMETILMEVQSYVVSVASKQRTLAQNVILLAVTGAISNAADVRLLCVDLLLLNVSAYLRSA